LEIDNLESIHSNRNIACMVLIMQALNNGGYPAELMMVEAPNSVRELKMLENGNVVIMHQDIWGASSNDSVYVSHEIIPRGKFTKGFYVAEPDRKMYGVKVLNDLKKFTSVSNPGWEVDWNTLKKIGLKKLYPTAKKEYMFNQVLLRDVDFTIQEFTTAKDMSYSFENGKLVPVPGIKIALDGSRHFMVSKKHKDGKAVFEALQKGLKILSNKGIVDKFLAEAGFYRSEVSEWQTIRVDL